MEYMRDRFEAWIKNTPQNNGNPYSKETISGYVSSLKTHAAKLSDLTLEKTDLFYYDDVNEFESIYRLIRASAYFEDINKANHRIFSSALNAYRRFLKANGVHEVDFMVNAFEEWLKKYKDHKYTEATVKRYIRALQKAEEWLGISLPKSVLNVDNLEEFQKIQSIIKGTVNFDSINQSHGHGDLSAALRAYERFMYDCESKGDENDQDRLGEGCIAADVNVKDTLEKIKAYIISRGFVYQDGLIENYYLSLKSKPFVILAGTSGTGKTRLVKLFAEAIGAGYEIVSVRPDWSDGSDLFGHTDLNGNFIPGPVCAAFEKAYKNPNRPVFLCLDEMNLARVEYYLSDFLSVIESREKNNNHILTGKIAQYDKGIPENLYIVGTVNMDETTFPFSKKVLDRANTIEFSYVNLIPKHITEEKVEPQNVLNDFLRSEYLVVATDTTNEEDLVMKTCNDLQDLNEILVKANAHVGFRVRDEIVFYMLYNKIAGNLLTYDQALDKEIMQKILPRIQGSSDAIKKLLIDMFKFCMGSGSGIDADTRNVGEQMKILAESAKYLESARKIGYMMTRFEDDGFTSYWL